MRAFPNRSGWNEYCGTNTQNYMDFLDLSNSLVLFAWTIRRLLAELARCVRLVFLAKKHSVGTVYSPEARTWAIPVI
jgi:hypothetical protein